MDESSKTRETVRAYVERTELRDWAALGRLLANDFVYEIPQTRERVRGRQAFLQFNEEYPGDWHLTPTLVLGDGHHGAAWLEFQVGGDRQNACVWFDLDDSGLITRVTDFWPEAYEPPPGREHLVERW